MGAESHAPDAYLLDTATLLWVIAEPDRLSRSARAIWTNPRAVIAVSVVSYWEIAIKAAKGIFNIEDVGE
jgi:PIN domain nuclease of toxin-antitoxin system